ncbi:hypothetical protein PINS_up007659 [Pythium insidiosum]|nr:hypothetical protein PINS_up007659 [Pythium insidiosum]
MVSWQRRFGCHARVANRPSDTVVALMRVAVEQHDALQQGAGSVASSTTSAGLWQRFETSLQTAQAAAGDAETASALRAQAVNLRLQLSQDADRHRQELAALHAENTKLRADLESSREYALEVESRAAKAEARASEAGERELSQLRRHLEDLQAKQALGEPASVTSFLVDGFRALGRPGCDWPPVEHLVECIRRRDAARMADVFVTVCAASNASLLQHAADSSMRVSSSSVMPASSSAPAGSPVYAPATPVSMQVSSAAADTSTSSPARMAPSSAPPSIRFPASAPAASSLLDSLATVASLSQAGSSHQASSAPSSTRWAPTTTFTQPAKDSRVTSSASSAKGQAARELFTKSSSSQPGELVSPPVGARQQPRRGSKDRAEHTRLIQAQHSRHISISESGDVSPRTMRLLISAGRALLAGQPVRDYGRLL